MQKKKNIFWKKSFFAFIQITLKVSIILANHTLYWIKIAISNIVGTFRDLSWTFNVVDQQCESIRSQSAFANFSVKLSVLFCAIFPSFQLLCLLLLAIYVFKVVIKEVFSIDEFSSVPFSDITTLLCNVQKYLHHQDK